MQISCGNNEESEPDEENTENTVEEDEEYSGVMSNYSISSANVEDTTKTSTTKE